MSENKNLSLFGGSRIVAKPDAQAMLKRMAGSASLDPRGAAADGADYLNFSGKRGVYELGADREDVDPAEYWMVNPYSFMDGYICWKGGRPAAKRMASIYDDPIPEPDQGEMGPFDEVRGEGWFQAKSFTLRSLETGIQALFTNNSKSGVSAIAGLQKEIAQDMAEHEETRYPIVTLDKESFVSQGQKNYKPLMVPVTWLSEVEIQEALALDNEEAALAQLLSIVQDVAAPKKTAKPRRALRRE